MISLSRDFFRVMFFPGTSIQVPLTLEKKKTRKNERIVDLNKHIHVPQSDDINLSMTCIKCIFIL